MTEAKRALDVLERLADALETEAERGRTSPPVTEAIEAFVTQLEAKGRSPSTVKSYRHRLGLIADRFGDIPTHHVTHRMLNEWLVDQRRQSKRFEDHPCRPTVKGGLSPATLRGRVQSVKAFFKWATARGYTDEDPAAPLRRPTYDPAAEGKAMNPTDLRAMISVAKRKADEGDPRDLAILLFMADTAARVGEVRNLRLADLDLEAFEATVAGKTGAGIVDFTKSTADALTDWLNARLDFGHDYVFVSFGGGNYGKPLKAGTIYQILKRLAKKAGVEGRYNPHAIRHMVGQRFTDESNLELARKKLRHSDISVTAAHYANQDRARMKKATDRLSLVDEAVREGGD